MFIYRAGGIIQSAQKHLSQNVMSDFSNRGKFKDIELRNSKNIPR